MSVTGDCAEQMSQAESVFEKAALASHLLTQQDLDEASGAIRSDVTEVATSLVEIADGQLAEKLVEMQRINRWQAEQLKLGNTRFHLKDYQIIDSLGQGGMGQVFKAEHSLMGRVVAIKVLPKGRSTVEAVANFQHEIRVLANLDHPNLVRAYDAGHDGNVHFLVTEFVPGADLRQLVRRDGKLNQQDAATMITATAMGLQHAHEQGLIHRDVKPGNIMVTPEGMVKVLDLGLAGFFQKELQTDDAENSVNRGQGRIVGTADYLAPEIIEGGAASPASDIYALGCTLYYAVTRKVPFPGGSSVQKCQRHLYESPLSPRRFNTELSEEMLGVLADMIDKNPNKRIQTAAGVIERMAPWARTALSGAVRRQHVGEGSTFARPTTLPPLHNSLFPDTRELPEIEAGNSESPSQISQGTDRPTHASQITIPELKEAAKGRASRNRNLMAQFFLMIARMSEVQFYLLVAGLVLFVLVLVVLLLY
jgi:serine/threonine protein kinase